MVTFGFNNDNGVFRNANDLLTNITPGTYDLYLKGPVHLTRHFTGVVLNAGYNYASFVAPEQKLIAGDGVNLITYPNLPPDSNNKVDIDDFTLLVQDYNKTGSPADFNLTGTVDIDDFLILVQNYNKTGEN